ncbi:tRNA (adenosine(37)-N6)-dimethylallyltransferase MiaA [Parasphingorhabdus sp.]
MSMVSPDNHNKKVALINGPTASGKSALALELAKKQPSIIINADSAQVYRDLQILSARPTEAEMGGVPNRLYGYIDGAKACSAARWARDAKAEIEAAHEASKLPILVGGTGLYVRVLLDGIAPIPEIDPDIRNEVRKLDTLDAHTALLNEDPASARRLNATDSSRVKRALEVIRSSGKPMEHWHQNMQGGIADDILLKPLLLLPPREWLYARCDLRFELMMQTGAKAEVEALLERGLPDDRPVMRAIGVPDIRAFLEGKIDEATAIEQSQMATRRYAKRQFTWFRNQSPSDWARAESNIDNDNINDIVRLLQ